MWLKKKLEELNKPLITSLTEKITKGENFSFIKRGDGEEACMNGEVGANCDGHNYSIKLGHELNKSYEFFDKQPNCYVVRFENQIVYNSLLHRIDSDINKIKDFYLSIRNSDNHKVFIGPQRLWEVAKILKAKHFIIPDVNMFDKFGYIFASNIVDATVNDAIFIIAGGMPAKPLIKCLLDVNKNITCIDIGSAFDALVNVSRTYQISTQEIRKLYEDCLR